MQALCEPWQTQWRVCGHCVSGTLDVELDEIEGIGEAMLAQQLVELHRLTDELHTVREVARPLLEDAVTGPRLALRHHVPRDVLRRVVQDGAQRGHVAAPQQVAVATVLRMLDIRFDHHELSVWKHSQHASCPIASICSDVEHALRSEAE